MVAHVENAGHARARFSRAHHLGRRAPAQQEPERIHHNGFAAAGLAGEEIQPRVKMDAQPLDDGIVLDHQFQQHLRRL